MKKTFYYLIFSILIFPSCNHSSKEELIKAWKKEIIAVEKEFMDMTTDQGLAVAFKYFAADTAALKRGDKLIIGKDAIMNSYRNNAKNTNVKLTWKPDFVDVAKCGDMAYTYGQYQYSFVDSAGIKRSSKGVFHTVWKRQRNGEWKYVFD